MHTININLLRTIKTEIPHYGITVYFSDDKQTHYIPIIEEKIGIEFENNNLAILLEVMRLAKYVNENNNEINECLFDIMNKIDLGAELYVNDNLINKETIENISVDSCLSD